MSFIFFQKLNFQQLNFIFFDAAEESQIKFQYPATYIMDNIIDLHHDIFSFLLLIATIVFYMIAASIYFFRGGRAETRRSFSFTHHTKLEVAWTLVPMFILLLIVVPSFVLLYSMDELHDFLVTLKVFGRQWYWTYEYSQTDINGITRHAVVDSYLLSESELPFGGFRLLEVDNRVVLPVETHTRVLITASDVLHSWAIPSFGVKMDACPGRLNQVNLYIYRLGVFFGQCSEICGVNHGFMPIVVESVLFHDYISFLKNLSFK